jgi:hypothetical protein
MHKLLRSKNPEEKTAEIACFNILMQLPKTMPHILRAFDNEVFFYSKIGWLLDFSDTP